MIEQKIEAITEKHILKICEREQCFDCELCTNLNKELVALIEQEQKPLVEALEKIKMTVNEQQEDWIAIERAYLPERILPYREIQVIIDTVLKGVGR